MSLIQFRGRSILPPLVKDNSFEEEDEQVKEDEFILSLPSVEALQVILGGLPGHSNCESNIKAKEKRESDSAKSLNREEKKFTNFRECNKNSIHKNQNDGDKNKATFIRYKQSVSNFIMQSNKSFSLKDCEDELQSEFKDACSSSGKFSNHEDEGISSENNEVSITESFASPPSTPSKVTSGVTNHQKLKVLQASGTDSSSYLQDYLQLLTSRSELTRVAKPRRELELRNDVFLERRGSAPLLPIKKSLVNSTRHRTSSGSSDKSGSYRSLGSIYLDSYLGNLTDHSWIIYPTGDLVTNSTQQLEKDKSCITDPQSFDLNGGDYLQRRLRFINPEKFFSVESKIDTLEEPSHSTLVMKSSNPAENDNELGLTDTSGIALSPDISSSSLDTDKLDASNPLSLTSLQEIDELKESPKSNELDDNKDNTQESCYSSDASPEDSMLNSKNDKKDNSAKLNVTFDNEPDEIISTKMASSSQTSEEKITPEEDEQDMKDDESTIASDDSSDLSTDEDAEDQVSMIVCDVQKSPENLHDESKESIYDDSLITNPNSNSLLSQASFDNSCKEKTSQSIEELSTAQNNSDKVSEKVESDLVISNLIKILKAKQEEELRKLKEKHEQEMENFVYELSKLTSSQKLAMANAYESPNNNNSFNEILKVMNISQNSSQASDVSDADENKENYNSVSSFNHTNLMPSFFLHDEHQENNTIRRPDVNKISQIFSPSKGNIQTMAKFLNLNPKVLTPKSCNEPSVQVVTISSDLVEPSKQFSQKQLEVELDLVPTRESDGVCTSSSSSTFDSTPEGISKLQAIVRGKRIRKLMKTSQVQQLLSTLKEVAKLAHQFHQDILMDNIRKGDIGFHKALYNEEQQAREKFVNIMVETSPVDQIRLIERERLIEQREKQRRVTTEQPRSNANHIPKLKLYSTTTSSSSTESDSKNQSSPRSLLMSPYKGNLKQISRKVYASELPRPCKTILATESKAVNKYPCISPRERQSLIPSQKSLVSKGISRHRIMKKIDTLPQTHVPPRRQNAPICKSDSGYLSNTGAKSVKVDRSSIPVRGDVIPSRQPWR